MDAHRLTRRSYFADFLMVPILIVGISAMYIDSFEVRRSTAILFACGMIAWSLSEYVVHRFVFHGDTIFSHAHRIHHGHPGDMVGANPAEVYTSFLILGLSLWVTSGVEHGAPVWCGFATGYLTYILMHSAIHSVPMGRFNPLRGAQRRHLAHHHGALGNYGVTTPLWDLLFGTYRRPRHRSQHVR